jgi:hypothetical protein
MRATKPQTAGAGAAAGWGGAPQVEEVQDTRCDSLAIAAVTLLLDQLVRFQGPILQCVGPALAIGHGCCNGCCKAHFRARHGS